MFNLPSYTCSVFLITGMAVRPMVNRGLGLVKQLCYLACVSIIYFFAKTLFKHAGVRFNPYGWVLLNVFNIFGRNLNIRCNLNVLDELGRSPSDLFVSKVDMYIIVYGSAFCAVGLDAGSS